MNVQGSKMIPYPAARRLCTASEFQLLEIVRAKPLQDATNAALKSKLARARKLLGKWRALATGQARQKGQTPEGTARKVEWFDEAVTRIDAELAKREKLAAAAAARKAAPLGRRKPAIKSTSPAKMKRPGAPATKAVETKTKARMARIVKSGTLRKRGHALASGRRSQARRNAK